MDKLELLRQYREKADVFYAQISAKNITYKEKAGLINKAIVAYTNEKIDSVLEQKLPYENQLDAILLIHYVSYVIMLEYRNKFWPYEYMAFARRIGEIWEPFCKIPFKYPVKELELFTPPAFEDVHCAVYTKTANLINDLNVSKKEKDELLKCYNDMWLLIDSGNINLSLDLHFKQNGVCYDVDYKSGFSSNEKGNTNRLLQVASIYNAFFPKHKNLIFVRQPEEENNHYLQTLKNSPYWQVFCADKAHEAIAYFTGFDLKKWMHDNMDWINDISADFKAYLIQNELVKYLTW